MEERARLALGGLVVAFVVGLVLEWAVLAPTTLPFGLRSLFIAVGAGAGMWLVGGELE